MKFWRIIRWWQIRRGICCPKCHADLREVAYCSWCPRFPDSW